MSAGAIALPLRPMSVPPTIASLYAALALLLLVASRPRDVRYLLNKGYILNVLTDHAKFESTSNIESGQDTGGEGFSVYVGRFSSLAYATDQVDMSDLEHRVHQQKQALIIMTQDSNPRQ
jgi:hypothetical protein